MLEISRSSYYAWKNRGISSRKQHEQKLLRILMSELTHKRSRLYSKADPTIEIKTINAELREVRKNIRICNNIFQDIETIREHQNYVIWLEQEAEKGKKRRYLGKER